MSRSTIQKMVDELDASPVRNYDPVNFAIIKGLTFKYHSSAIYNNAGLEKVLRARIKEYQSSIKIFHKQAAKIGKAITTKFPKHANTVQSLTEQCQLKKLERLSNRLNKTLEQKTTLNTLKVLTEEINHSTDQASSQQLSLKQLLLNQEKELQCTENNPLSKKIEQKDKPRDLKSMKEYRETKKYFEVDKVIERAINSEPENPGPHNPHMLAINALTQIRDLSPQYTRRFTNHFDTLLWLEKNATKLI